MRSLCPQWGACLSTDTGSDASFDPQDRLAQLSLLLFTSFSERWSLLLSSHTRQYISLILNIDAGRHAFHSFFPLVSIAERHPTREHCRDLSRPGWSIHRHG